MRDARLESIDVNRLRIGLYIHLDMGWTGHPFPLSNFKIKSEEQIAILKGLGVATVRYSPGKSDVLPMPPVVEPVLEEKAPVVKEESAEDRDKRERKALLAAQQASLALCNNQFSRASAACQKVMVNAKFQPAVSKEAAGLLVNGLVDDISGAEELSIRLLSEQAGEQAALHAINVTVLAVILAKAMGVKEDGLRQIGLAAMLHDIGKVELPARMRIHEDSFSKAENALYQQHVTHGVDLARRMQLDSEIVSLIAQHHEHLDGTGFPHSLREAQIAKYARVIAIANHYDNLCNPGNFAHAMTPHDALAFMYSRKKNQFDVELMMVFIKMMGIYPPGSVVQLTDERFAMVVSVNSSRPLKPRVVIYEPGVSSEDLVIVDLEKTTELGIHHSVKASSLPRAVHDVLSPRQRTCYFFERQAPDVRTQEAM